MKNIGYKKGIVFGIIILFIGINISSVVATKIDNDPTDIVTNTNIGFVYVDDDNTEGPWDGTLQHPYRYIKDGINNAEKGDTVFVFKGLYHEGYLKVQKSIDIWGESRDETIVDGEGAQHTSIFTVFADGVKIHGFTIRNCKFEIWRGKGIDIYSNRCVISGNKIINNNEHGIVIAGEGSIEHAFNTVRNNIIEGHKESGICLWYTRNNKIIDNHIESNAMGIYVFSGFFNTIRGNNIEDNGGMGLLLESSFLNTIKRNNFINHNINAYMDHAPGTRWSSNYWDDWDHSGPYKISGVRTIIKFFPWPPHTEEVDHYNYDYSPKSNPYILE